MKKRNLVLCGLLSMTLAAQLIVPASAGESASQAETELANGGMTEGGFGGEIEIPEELDRNEIVRQIEIQIKYEGYIDRQHAQVEHMRKLEEKKIPQDIDYSEVRNLRIEARQKLEKIRPESIGQASRISGVSPADISMLMLYLKN